MPDKDRELLEVFVRSMPPEARILDLGCGSGIPFAELLIARGFSVLGIDQSPRLLQHARSNLPQGTFERADLEDYQIRGSYDGVVLWDALFHIRREEHRPILERVYAALNPGGTLMMSSGGSEQEPFTDSMFGVEFFYDAFAPPVLRALVREIGFAVLEASVLNEPDGGRDKGRIGLILSKP